MTRRRSRSTATWPRRSSGKRTIHDSWLWGTGSSPFSRLPNPDGRDGHDEEMIDELVELLDSVFLDSTKRERISRK